MMHIDFSTPKLRILDVSHSKKWINLNPSFIHNSDLIHLIGLENSDIQRKNFGDKRDAILRANDDEEEDEEEEYCIPLLIRQFATGLEASYTDVVKAHKELCENDKKWEELAEFAKIFEFPELMDPSKQILDRLHIESGHMLQMWHFVDMIDLAINEWKKTLWNDINCEEIEDGAKGLYKQLRAMDKFVKTTNTYTVTQKNRFLLYVPFNAIENLASWNPTFKFLCAHFKRSLRYRFYPWQCRYRTLHPREAAKLISPYY